MRPTDMGLAGKVAVVTGGSGLVGSSVSRALAAAGASVCVGYLGSESAATALVAEIAPIASGRCTARRVPVASDADCAAAIDAIAADYGRIDILVHAAGISPGKPLRMAVAVDVVAPFEVNTFGAMYAARSVLPWMIRQRWGRIILVGSRASAGAPGAAVYSASKSALVGLARSAAKEYARYGVTVNVVSPGRIEGSPATSGPGRESLLASYPMGRFVQPEEVAHLIAFIAGDHAGAITGQEIVIDAGADGSAAPTGSGPRR